MLFHNYGYECNNQLKEKKTGDNSPFFLFSLVIRIPPNSYPSFFFSSFFATCLPFPNFPCTRPLLWEKDHSSSFAADKAKAHTCNN